MDSLSHITLLYELSVKTLKHLDPKETAKTFINTFLSRKNLSYGAIWLTADGGEEILFSSLYSLPSSQENNRLNKNQFLNYFKDENLVIHEHSMFNKKISGNFAYVKLGEFGILEVESKSKDIVLDRDNLYPFIEVFNQLAVSLESSYSYQNLEKEIKQRKQAEKSLEANEEKYKRIVDNIELGLLEVDANDIISHANNAFCKLVEYELHEIIGKNASELLLRESDRESMKKRNASRKRGNSDVYQIPVITKSGTEKWMVISGAPNFDSQGNQVGSIGIHLDISDQRRLANENAFKDSKLSNLFEVSLDALISVNDLGVVIEWNPQAEKIFGYTKEEIMGQELSKTIIPHAFRKAHSDGMDNFHKTGHGPVLNKRIEITALRKNGEEFPIELTIFPIEHHDSHYFTAFVRDITEIKQSRETMTEALKQQTELNTLKSKFVSMTSHELRTPLTTISTDIELMNYYIESPKEVDKSKLSNIVNRMNTNADRLNHLISNILLIGQLDSDKVPFNPEPIEVSEYFEKNILPNYTNGARKLTYSIEGNPYNLNVDKNLFTQINDNLISNAFKYSEGGKAPEVVLEYRETEFLLHVKDFGIGIPKSDQEKLFSTFFRASNVGNVQGSGLGLTIVNEFVKLHEGLITFNSKESEGTTFTVRIPVD
ncbi:MAG: PAS domain-containing sensor histidine kinase [bacterium]|nr:PAS domain-containing sensor histidine kinase [bacterium]